MIMEVTKGTWEHFRTGRKFYSYWVKYTSGKTRYISDMDNPPKTVLDFLATAKLKKTYCFPDKGIQANRTREIYVED